MDPAIYQKIYYRRKKRILSLKRKKRYRENEEYRENVKARARAQQAKRINQREPVIRGSNLAEMLGLPPGTIYTWYRKNIFPPIAASDKGKPLFTPAQAELIKEVRDKFPFKRFRKEILESFKLELQQRWEEANGEEGSGKIGGHSNRNTN